MPILGQWLLQGREARKFTGEIHGTYGGRFPAPPAADRLGVGGGPLFRQETVRGQGAVSAGAHPGVCTARGAPRKVRSCPAPCPWLQQRVAAACRHLLT